MTTRSPTPSAAVSPASSLALAQSWRTVVNSIESLTPELLDSSCPASGNYSREDDDLFWSMVHQGYSATFDEPSAAEDLATLRQLWESICPSVATFEAILTELWPEGPVLSRDQLPRQRQDKLVQQAMDVFRGRMDRDFELLEVWSLLSTHESWWNVLRPLVLRDASAAAGTGGHGPKGAAQHELIPDLQELENAEFAEKRATDRPEVSKDEGAVGAPSVKDFGSLAKTVNKVTGAKRRKPTPRRVQPLMYSIDEEGNPAPVGIEDAKTNEEKAGKSPRFEPIGEKTQAGDAAVVTPTHSCKKQRKSKAIHARTMQSSTPAKAGSPIQMDSNSSQGGEDVQGQQNASTAATVPEDVEVAPEEKADKPGCQTSRYLEDVNLALAWISVSCSFADKSPQLDEANDWFWLLASSIYYDLAPNQIHTSDVETMLKNRWQQVRRPIANFHRMYEAGLPDKSQLARADREAAVAAAQEAYWSQHGHWFQHRAVWEVLERHTDWNAVLRPLFFGTEASKSVSEVGQPKNIPGDSTLSADSNTHVNTSEDEAKSDGLADSVEAPRPTEGKGRPVVDDAKLKTNDYASLSQPEFVVAAIGKAESEKQHVLARQWLELSSQHLEFHIMTHTDEGLTPAGIEYLRLRREDILKKERSRAVGK